MFCPLSLTDDTGKTLWSQDAPNVANSQRPLLVQMGKELQETFQSLALFERDIEKLANDMVIGNHNVKLTIQGHMLDRKAADIFTGLGGSYCDPCDFSKDQCLQKDDIIESGFEIIRDINTLKQIFDELVNKDGSIEKCVGELVNEDGSIEKCVGELVNEDGSVEKCVGELNEDVNEDGSIEKKCVGELVNEDGSIEKCVGERVNEDGSIEKCVGELVNEDGSNED